MSYSRRSLQNRKLRKNKETRTRTPNYGTIMKKTKNPMLYAYIDSVFAVTPTVTMKQMSQMNRFVRFKRRTKKLTDVWRRNKTEWLWTNSLSFCVMQVLYNNTIYYCKDANYRILFIVKRAQVIHADVMDRWSKSIIFQSSEMQMSTRW